MNGQFLYLLLAAAAVWFFNRKSAAAARDRPGKPPANQPAEEEAERTRRVREEVRRKIAERRSESGRPPLFAPERAARPPGPPRIPPPPLRPAPAPVETGEELTVLATQRKLEEQMRALEAAEAAGKRARQPGSLGQPSGPPPGLQLGGAGLRASMAAPAGVVDIQELRRAMVWREILGKPVGLR